MSYFSGIFTTQYHKSKSGYFLNHDILMSSTHTNQTQSLLLPGIN